MKSPLHVAMIIRPYHPPVGGAERQLAALIPLLKSDNIEVTVITRRYAGQTAFEMVADVPVHRMPIPGPKQTASLSFTLTALPLLGRLKPDIIHAHELLSPTTTAIAAKRLFGTPVVAKVLRGGTLGDVAKLQRRRTGRKRLSIFKEKVDSFIVISQEIDAELDKLGIAPPKRYFNPNGVDTRRFSPLSPSEKENLRQKLGLSPGPIAVFTGRLSAEKRIDQLIGLWPSVRAAYPQAALLIVGEGEDEALLKTQAGVGVTFCGRIEDVVPYLQVADLFVLPSSTEGLSNAMLEAMSVGLATISTRVGGAADVITNQVNGWLIQPDHPEELRGALLTLMGDPPRRAALGSQAREKMIRDYALTTVAARLRELYDKVIADRV